jgi:adenosylcobinamide kinase / adenosylcobinamide-phosphate guanylyltransferase
MLIFISGGVRSGKSSLGERLTLKLANARKVYLATAKPYDSEIKKRILKHQFDRKDKGFFTIEKSEALEEIMPMLKKDDTILLDCLGALLSNEMYTNLGQNLDDNFIISVRKNIFNSIVLINSKVSNIIVISNEIFSDGIVYDPSIEAYIKVLGELHQQISNIADNVIECSFGNNIVHKGNISI